MKFHGIEMVGPLTLEKLDTLPAWTPQWEGRLVYIESNSTIYYGKGAYWQSIAIGDTTAIISDEPYDATTWDDDITNGASKNALRDKFESIQDILDLLLPTQPDGLSSIALVMVSANNQARRADGTNMRSVVAGSVVTVTYATTPQVQSAAEFYNGDAGLLQAIVNDVATGSRELSAADDTGTYTSLIILTDVDYYAGEGAPKEGFWKVLTASIQNVGQTGTNDFKLSHSLTGDSTIQFIKDSAPGTPVMSLPSGPLFPTPTLRWISGVPSLAYTDIIRYSVSVTNLVGECYHRNNPLLAVSSYIAASVPLQFSSPPVPGVSLAGTIDLVVDDQVYVENFQWTGQMYHAYPLSTPAASDIQTINARVDTVSIQEDLAVENGIEVDTDLRLVSGEGQYPATGYGGTFDPTKSLADANYPELQQVNGKFQFPHSVNYATNLPTAGPNYVGLTGDSISGQNWRWYTRQIHTNGGTPMRSLTFQIEDAENFNDILDANLLLYVKVEGATGWLDANAAYPGTGSPSTNGQPALDVGNSTPTSRRITFGLVDRTGIAYVRLGLPSGSNKKFSSITIVETT